MTTRADPHCNDFDGTAAERAELRKKMRALGLSRKRTKQKPVVEAVTVATPQAASTVHTHAR
jgi:hypothetical protein